MKLLYEAPTVQVIDMELQGVIAASGGFGAPGIPGEGY